VTHVELHQPDGNPVTKIPIESVEYETVTNLVDAAGPIGTGFNIIKFIYQFGKTSPVELFPNAGALLTPHSHAETRITEKYARLNGAPGAKVGGLEPSRAGAGGFFQRYESSAIYWRQDVGTWGRGDVLGPRRHLSEVPRVGRRAGLPRVPRHRRDGLDRSGYATARAVGAKFEANVGGTTSIFDSRNEDWNDSGPNGEIRANWKALMNADSMSTTVDATLGGWEVVTLILLPVLGAVGLISLVSGPPAPDTSCETAGSHTLKDGNNNTIVEPNGVRCRRP
jgi:hypothetical protein